MRHLIPLIACMAAVGLACGTDDGGGAGGSGGSGGTGGTGGTGGVACEIPQGAPIEVPDATWTWVPIEGNRCRDGSPTGIGVYRKPEATRLVIYLEGGGACFNQLSCGQNPATFGQAEFEAMTFGGILDVTDDRNPLADSSFVYVPYCTGDVHGGSNESGDVRRGPEDQAFVGFDNVQRALQRIVPTFADVEQVVLTGASAGGFGALVNYDQVSRAFCSESVVLLDDSGFPLADEFLAPCLQQEWRDLWNFAETLPSGCEACSGADGGGLVNYLPFLAERYPEGRFAFISSTRDQTIGQFFSFGLDECATLVGGVPDTNRGVEVFAEGLQALLDGELADLPNATSYVIDGSDHTFTVGARLHSTTVGTTSLADWIRAVVEGPLPETVRP